MGNVIISISEVLLEILTAYALSILYAENWYYKIEGNPIQYKMKSLLHCWIYLICFYVWTGTYKIFILFTINCILIEIFNNKIISKNITIALYLLFVFLLYIIF